MRLPLETDSAATKLLTDDCKSRTTREAITSHDGSNWKEVLVYIGARFCAGLPIWPDRQEQGQHQCRFWKSALRLARP
eukprot:4840818-Amphidinium_carterae.1